MRSTKFDGRFISIGFYPHSHGGVLGMMSAELIERGSEKEY